MAIDTITVAELISAKVWFFAFHVDLVILQ